jgi:DNA-binding NarL/FixJ family response regulator
MKVLVVVEDDDDMRLLMEVMLDVDPRLQLSGTAATAAEAIAAALRLQPDLVVLDHFIDGDTMGIEAAPGIKAVAPDVAILLCTSHDLQVEADRSTSIDGYLNKRDIARLLETVQHMLGLHRVAS